MSLNAVARSAGRIAQRGLLVWAALILTAVGGAGTALAGTALAGIAGSEALAPASYTLAGTEHGSLAAEAHRELSAARQTRYQHITDVDEQTGRFDYDCSGFVGYALRRIDPAAYRALPVSKTRPLAQDIVTAIRAGGFWQRVPAVTELGPGDLVAWLTPDDSDSDNTGHVMIVLAVPTRSQRAGEWLVQVADSTTSPHAADRRVAGGPTGLGQGTIGLTTDTSERPVAYYWRGGVSTKLEHTEIALGRLR